MININVINYHVYSYKEITKENVKNSTVFDNII